MLKFNLEFSRWRFKYSFFFQHRKELVDAIHHGKLVLKSGKTTSNTQSRMPSYGTQVPSQFCIKKIYQISV